MTSTHENASRPGGVFRPRILLGVSGGIAAYKSAILLRRLKEWGADVRVVPTPASLEMVGRTTWEALSGHPAYVHVPEEADEVAHVRTGAAADLFIVAPATANTIAKLATGMADNMLTASALVATCPLIIAPAMHTQMWEHPATVSNIDLLASRGAIFAGPVSGRLTGVDSGAGRMMEPEDIASIAIANLVSRGFCGATSDELHGVHFVISAGGTREPIDPVRFIGNRSSGRMGIELAQTALKRGACVTFVAANIPSARRELPGATVVDVETAAQLHSAMNDISPSAHVVVMAAAVSDYRVAASKTKIKRQGQLHLDLEENPDILADLAHHRRRDGQVVVGFAAETGDDTHTAYEYGVAKAKRKGADLLVINQVGTHSGFGDVDTEITIVDPHGRTIGHAEGSKHEVSVAIVNAIVANLS
ncbi:bifunctional phosphopantothenoylcysteine decarboxylase/phosphopantothenate--cysteine ligase CoaBC [Arcanobacterium canis]|uniref:Coenzyme A biosynthesis bifunctional protein CoaBC n=1 Tax=Arcanobacterium canis TaxID=999183 RepID=A0ABY8FXZ7_9ACTO|nr:bifunctional phosphopantothenoylcysteine decarboxylase/phosphopantothenate--cysteine ligase CoaBC [Arcanobacterium canis]WFM82640.1 bifunctional phosphopantothenoylcysteine decarboxylase/phosphopantothenate--cysteine ligase CoaBC [Arcanobacterium canis]